MTLLDALIIYFACGAPLGAYYFIKNRHDKSALWLKTILVTILWIPFSAKLLHRKFWTKVEKRKKDNDHSINSQDIQLLAILKSDLEQFVPKEQSNISLFDFREMIERYAGLTIAIQSNNGLSVNHQHEIFRISQSNNIELSSLCFNRRNRQKLLVHQTQARMDFIETMKNLSVVYKGNENLDEYAIRFVSYLKDKETKNLFDNKSFSHPPKGKCTAVGFSGEDLWTPQELQ